jgi:SAM-dependent methyltransferase
MSYRIFNISIPFNCDDPRGIEARFRENPASLQYQFDFAEALAANGQFAKAHEIFVKLSLIPSPQENLLLMKAALTAYYAENYPAGLRFFSKLLASDPDNYIAHLLSGTAYYYLGLYHRANFHWWAAHQIDRNDFIMQIMGQFFVDDFHPERIVLYPICESGKGIDVGCGHRKTHPNAIGVDLNAIGDIGKIGNVAGHESVAEIKSRGDELTMFADNDLDFVVQRHNLEHYQDCIKALQEWKRVLKPGGLLGMVVPDDEFCDTIHLDPTHYHVFTKDSLKRILDLIGGFRVVVLKTFLKKWSFVCIVQKTEGLAKENDEPVSQFKLRQFAYERDQLLAQAQLYEDKGFPVPAAACREFLNELEQGSVEPFI